MSKKIGIVLGGGAARGYAHIGILKAFYENNIIPDYIAGTSMGAIIAALISIGMTPHEIEEKTKYIKLIDMFDIKLSKAGLIPGDKAIQALKKLIGYKLIEKTKIPLRICAVDIERSKKVFFKEGRIINAVRASISVPGIFTPFKYKNSLYIDGGVMSNLPIEALDEFKCDKKIAISVRKTKSGKTLYREYIKSNKGFFGKLRYTRLKLISDILKRSYDIIMSEQEKRSKEKYPECKIFIPVMKDIDYIDFNKKTEIIKKGYEEGLRMVRVIRAHN